MEKGRKLNEYISVQELCETLGISKGYVYQLTCKRKIPFHKPWGKKVYFLESEIVEHFEKNRISSEKDLKAYAYEYTQKHLNDIL